MKMVERKAEHNDEENGVDSGNEWFNGVDFSKIPVVTKSSDDDGHSQPIGFRVMPRLVRMASIIKENSPLKCYKTASDVYKHAFYLGLQLIYHLE